MSGTFGENVLNFFSGTKDFYSHTIDQSLRFDDGDNPYLSKTFSSSGGTIFTFSCWVKLGNIDINRCLLQGYADGNNFAQIVLYSGNYIGMYSATSGTARLFAYTQALQRDPSAWYHIVVKFNGTSGSEEFKIYVNGENQTLTTSTSLSAHQSNIGNSNAHYIGNNFNQSLDMDGYMAEVNFIDGTALDADSFGETKSGIWIPKEYSGSYGTNGFHLTFKESGDLGADSSYTTHDIFGDSSAVATYIFDGSIVDAGGSYNGTTSNVTFTDGIVGTQAGVFNGSNSKWVAGTHLFGSHPNDIDTSVSGWFQVSSNYQYLITDGFLGTGGGFFLVQTNGSGKLVAGTGNSSGTNNILITSDATITDGKWHHFAFTKTVGGGTATGKLWVDGNYEGSDTTTSTIAHSNETAFGHRADANLYYSCTLDQVRIFNRELTEAEVMQLAGQFGSDESGVNNDFNHANISPTDVILDSPTNNWATMNPLDGNGPTISEGNLKVFGDTASSVFEGFKGTFPMSSGKWYWEMNAADVNNLMQVGITPTTATAVGSSTNLSYHTDAMIYNNGGTKAIGTGGLGTSPSTKTTTSYGNSYTDGDIIGVALDLDSSTTTLTFYKNNSSEGTAFSSLASDEYVALFTGIESSFGIFNFGQDSSFAGTKTAQGNTDDNGIGDFYYSPPSGFLACCVANLPDPGIDPARGEEPADYFNTVLYSGNGSSGHAITGVGFQPDWVWLKGRNYNGASYSLTDSVRGATKRLSSDSSSAEATNAEYLQSFDSDGFTVGDHAAHNSGSHTFVAWNWLAGGSASSNSEGDITASVSANTEAGFSIVGFNATGSTATVGHGLSKAPEFIIAPQRTGSAWNIFAEPIGNTKRLRLDTTAAEATSGVWGNTDPTSTVFTQNITSTTNAIIAYCFHSVDGYCDIGSYTGNGSSDGAFIYTGFRPAWLLVKNIDATHSWRLWDNKRAPINVASNYLSPDSSSSEGSVNIDVDLLSNGFKMRNSNGSINASSNDYIYLAFAEQPFKYANAR